jgi:membrane associated rhomboid family serine protease
MEAQSTEPRYCYRHPDRETGLSCSECGRPICYECMTPAAVGLRCPEHSGKPQGVRKVTATATRAATGFGPRRANAITMALIGVNVLVYALELGGGGSVQGTGNWIYEHGVLIANGVYDGGQLQPVPQGVRIPPGFDAAGVQNGEWWRLLTSAFLHYGPLHLAMNMFSLYFAGSILEQVIGRARFVLLYLAAGLAGAAGALLWSPNAATVGASGAIFGILGALFVLERRGNIATGGQVAALIVLNLVITFAYSSSISVGGHLGGLVGGLVVMAALVRFRDSMQLSVLASAAVAVAAIAVAYSSV